MISVYDTNKFQTCCFVYKSLNGFLPNIFNGIFVTNSDMHDHNTRQRTKLHVISHRIKVREFSIKIYGTKQWNSLDKSVIESPSFYIFKKRCKALILQHPNFNQIKSNQNLFSFQPVYIHSEKRKRSRKPNLILRTNRNSDLIVNI